MSIGGRNIGWDNTTPGANDDAGLGDDHFRSVKTSIQTALDAEHEFSTTGGANTGRHRPGSAYPYVDVESNVSAGDVAGRLYATSDRLFVLGDSASSATIFVGSKNAVEHAEDTGTFNHLWVEESGAKTLLSSQAVVGFSSEYSGIPHVQISAWTDSIPSAGSNLVYHLSLVTTGGFVAQVRLISTGAGQSNGTIMWRSIGTRLFGS
jgi:hypothetical protein